VNTIVERSAELNARLPQYRFRYTIVNDGSTRNISDSSIDKLRKALPGLKWMSYPVNRGKGYALRHGIRETTSDIVIYTDIDLPYTTASMAKCILAVADENYDLSIAVRNRSYYARLPFGRRLLSKGLRNMNKTIFRLKTADTQGGLKVFSMKARKHFLETTIDRYLFDLEFVYLCSRDAEVRIAPIPSDMRDTIEFSKVPLSVIRREGWNFLQLMLRGPA
jgi:glycosyltransferase involved in cell wall biosynthesis